MPIAFLHLEGTIVDLRMASSTGSGPVDGRRPRSTSTKVSGPRRGVTSRLVRPPVRASPASTAAAPGRRSAAALLASTLVTPAAAYLERLARPRRHAARSCAWASIRTPRRCRPGSPPTSRRGGFARALLEARLPFAAAVKPNLAFFEAFGSAGIAALERLRAAIPADVPFMDAKRGDIGSTAARQAVALFDGLGADAITVSPYLGEEAIAPLLARVDRFAYVLCRTSNPGRGRAPGRSGRGRPGEPARPPSRSRRGSPGARGLGTRADRRPGRRRDGAGRARPDPGLAPGLAFLVPGVGAQGGESSRSRRRTRHRCSGRRTHGWRSARQRLARDRRAAAGEPAAGVRGRRRAGERSRQPPASGPPASPVLPCPSRARRRAGRDQKRSIHEHAVQHRAR